MLQFGLIFFGGLESRFAFSFMGAPKMGGLGSLSCMGTVFWENLSCFCVGHYKSEGTA